MADTQKDVFGVSPSVSFTPVTTRLASSSDLEIIISSSETLSVSWSITAWSLTLRFSRSCNLVSNPQWIASREVRMCVVNSSFQVSITSVIAFFTIFSRNGSKEPTSTTDPDFSPLFTDGLAFLGPDPLLFGELSGSSCKRVFPRADMVSKAKNLSQERKQVGEPELRNDCELNRHRASSVKNSGFRSSYGHVQTVGNCSGNHMSLKYSRYYCSHYRHYHRSHHC